MSFLEELRAGPDLKYFRDSVCTGMLSLEQPPLIGI